MDAHSLSLIASGRKLRPKQSVTYRYQDNENEFNGDVTRILKLADSLESREEYAEFNRIFSALRSLKFKNRGPQQHHVDPPEAPAGWGSLEGLTREGEFMLLCRLDVFQIMDESPQNLLEMTTKKLTKPMLYELAVVVKYWSCLSIKGRLDSIAVTEPVKTSIRNYGSGAESLKVFLKEWKEGMGIKKQWDEETLWLLGQEMDEKISDLGKSLDSKDDSVELVVAQMSRTSSDKKASDENQKAQTDTAASDGTLASKKRSKIKLYISSGTNRLPKSGTAPQVITGKRTQLERDQTEASISIPSNKRARIEEIATVQEDASPGASSSASTLQQPQKSEGQAPHKLSKLTGLVERLEEARVEKENKNNAYAEKLAAVKSRPIYSQGQFHAAFSEELKNLLSLISPNNKWTLKAMKMHADAFAEFGKRKQEELLDLHAAWMVLKKASNASQVANENYEKLEKAMNKVEEYERKLMESLE